MLSLRKNFVSIRWSVAVAGKIRIPSVTFCARKKFIPRLLISELSLPQPVLSLRTTGGIFSEGVIGFLGFSPCDCLGGGYEEPASGFDLREVGGNLRWPFVGRVSSCDVGSVRETMASSASAEGWRGRVAFLSKASLRGEVLEPDGSASTGA